MHWNLSFARVAFLLGFCGLTAPGCWCGALNSAALADGIADYDHARYPEALSGLRGLERSVPALSADQQARYALYRGLSELSLGNACDAYAWLSRSQRLVRAQPMLLSRADHGRLEAAWRSLGKMPGQLR